MSENEITPALSAEEWVVFQARKGVPLTYNARASTYGEGATGSFRVEADIPDDDSSWGAVLGTAYLSLDPGRESLRLAAMLLQRAAPDGGPLFTWEDVDRQNARAEEFEILGMHEEARPWRDLAARLASILPPRTEPEP